MNEELVCDCPETIQEKIIGEFILSLNNIGEMRITTKYDDTTFVVDDKQTKEFIQILTNFQSLKGK